MKVSLMISALLLTLKSIGLSQVRLELFNGYNKNYFHLQTDNPITNSLESNLNYSYGVDLKYRTGFFEISSNYLREGLVHDFIILNDHLEFPLDINSIELAANFYLPLKGRFEIFFSTGLKLNIARLAERYELRGLDSPLFDYYLVGSSATVVSDNGSYISQIGVVYSPFENYFIGIYFTTNIGLINFYETRFTYYVSEKGGGIIFTEDAEFLNAGNYLGLRLGISRSF